MNHAWLFDRIAASIGQDAGGLGRVRPDGTVSAGKAWYPSMTRLRRCSRTSSRGRAALVDRPRWRGRSQGQSPASAPSCSTSARSRPGREHSRAPGTWADLSVVELNEAFACPSPACPRPWPDLDPSIVDVHGAAITLGHPLACAGGRGGWDAAVIRSEVSQVWPSSSRRRSKP
jgi:Thiolase, C-terminal domain